MKRFVIVFAIVANLVLADAVAKELARGYLRGASGERRVVEVVSGVFNLAYVENRGCAWGMLQGQVWPLGVFGIVALAFLLGMRRKVFGSDRPGAMAEPLLYAGIIGNAIDRFARGYVIDMLDFHLGSHHFPCFNLADAFICIAVGLLLISARRG